MTDADLIQRYSKIPYTGAIADILAERGLRNQTLPHGIQAVGAHQVVAGRALTVIGEPTDSEDDEVVIIPYLEMLGSVRDGDVIVIQANNDTVAHIGELSSETAQSRGARGAIIDGGARDLAYIDRIGFPVFARYRTPADIKGNWRVAGRNIPIKIGEVDIAPGDYIVGDCDGVVVIPSSVAQSVLEEAEGLVDTEDVIRAEILAGRDPVDAFRSHGRF